MLYVGCHLSASNGLLALGKTALEIHANTFQFFPRNPRGGAFKPFLDSDIQGLNQIIEEHHFAPVLAHASYTLNPCSLDPRLREYAKRVLAEDLERLSPISKVMLNFHPGSHVKQGAEAGISLIAKMLNEILKPEQKVWVLLETMAGKGSEVGRTFEELKAIIDRTEYSEKLGVCLDTCHIHDAGYDIVNHLEECLEKFDSVIGLSKLKAIHLNDSKNPLASRKDRHELLGKGFIGEAALLRIINHPRLKHLPFYLETPNDVPGYASEIQFLREHFVE